MVVFSVWTKEKNILAFSKVHESMAASPFMAAGGMKRYAVNDGCLAVFRVDLPFKNIWPYIGLMLVAGAILFNKPWLLWVAIPLTLTAILESSLFYYLMLLARLKKDGQEFKTKLVSNDKTLGMIADGTARNLKIS